MLHYQNQTRLLIQNLFYFQGLVDYDPDSDEEDDDDIDSPAQKRARLA